MKKTDAPLRFAVIGCGMLARQAHIPNLVHSPKTTLQLCCDLDEDVLATCRREYGVAHTTTDLAEAIQHPEVDAICLATTERLRKEPIELAAKAGKPVYVEKPLAKELDEAYAIQQIVREAGIPFCVGHNRRSSPAMLTAHQIFRSHMERPVSSPWRYDREGEARPTIEAAGAPAFTCRINDDFFSWKAWTFDPEHAPHGPMLYEMTHFVDVANWFFQAQPVEAVALEPNPLNHGVVIVYDNGGVATITMSGNGTFGYPKELYEIAGNAGIVVIDHMVELRTAGIEGAPDVQRFPLAHDPFPEIGREGGLHGWLAKQRAAERRATEAGTHALSYAPQPDKGHAHQLECFVDEIRGRGPTVCGVDEAVLATETCFAAIEAAHRKQAVTLEEVRQSVVSTS